MAYTANFLTVNGLDVPAMSAGQRRTDPDRWGRGNGTEYTGTTYAKKRQFAFETPPTTPLEAQALSGWVRGLGHHFTFEWTDDHRATTQFTLYSTEGGAVLSGGTAATVDVKFGSYSLLIPGNNTYTTTVQFGSEGPHSFSVWRNQISANVWELCSAAHDGSTTRYFAGTTGTGLTTAFAWSSLVASDGYLRVALEGQNPAGSSATCLYDGLMVLPYSLTTPQLTARNGRLNAEPGFPLVAVGGHMTQAVPEIACKGFVKDYPVHRVVLDGRWYDNARQTVGTLVESHELTTETVLPTEPVPTIEDLILADPDLFLYYPLTDASNPGTVADLGPGGYDLTVYDADNVFTFGATGPTAEVPLWLASDYTFPSNGAYNYLARSEATGPVHPAANVSVGFVMRGQSYSGPFCVSQIYGWSGGAGGTVYGNQVYWVPAASQVVWYVGNQTVTFTSVPSPSADEKHYVFSLDTVAGSASLFINGTLHQTITGLGAYSPPTQSRTLGVLLFTQATSYSYQCPPSSVDINYSLEGGMVHWFMSARALSAADALALAQAAGFA